MYKVAVMAPRAAEIAPACEDERGKMFRIVEQSELLKAIYFHLEFLVVGRSDIGSFTRQLWPHAAGSIQPTAYGWQSANESIQSVLY